MEFDDVKFAYNEDEEVLRGLSFAVDKGEFVAFVGQSGAGKSTIVSLIARMYNPDLVRSVPMASQSRSMISKPGASGLL